MSRFLTMVTIMKLSSLVTRLFFDDKGPCPKGVRYIEKRIRENEFIEPFLDCRPQIKNLLQM